MHNRVPALQSPTAKRCAPDMNRIAPVLGLLLAGLLAAACSGAGKTYATLADARAARLFERGWLPDILPPSSQRIAVATDLYLGVADGRFEFAERDSAAFFSRVKPATVTSRWKPEWKEFHVRWSNSGFRGYTFGNDMSSWLFMCGAPTGGYRTCVWLKRSSA